MDFDRQKSKSSIWIRFLLLASLAVAVGWGANAFFRQFADGVPRLDRRTLVIETVKRGDMVHEIRGIGQLVSEEVTWVSAESAGHVTEIAILPGVTVDRSTIILKLRNLDLELSVTEADSAVQMAAATLRAERARLESLDLKMESELTALKGEFDQAQATYEITKSLFEQKAMSPHELQLNTIKMKSLKNRLEVDSQAHKGFQKSLDDQLAGFEEKLKQAQAKLEREQRKLESMVVRAQRDGVLAQLPVEVGQQVSGGDVLAKIVDPRQLKAVIRVPEVQANYITKGQLARIDTHHGIVVGHVTRIDPEVKDGSIAVDVSFADSVPSEARPDLSVVGMIEVARLTDVLFVGRPADATANESIDLYVFDPDADYFVRSPVEVGVASVNQIEIKAGLQEGDELILSDTAQFSDAKYIRLK